MTVKWHSAPREKTFTAADKRYLLCSTFITYVAAIASVKIAAREPSYIATYIHIGLLREDNSQF